MSSTKSFDISKHVVMEAYKRVKANKGAAGVDNESLAEFEINLKDNLYKLWNRLSSGSYFPPAVRVVEIPKKDGSKRKLGIPTVSDRIAQMVAKLYLEPEIEPNFHYDSYGYRPSKSALDAVDICRKRCWKYHWVIDIDIKGFFDNLDHELLMRAVEKHTSNKWLRLYIKRWLTVSMILPNGQEETRVKGTPQGGVISPLLANLYLHYAFDKWMEKHYPCNPFERYADDMIVHCFSQNKAESLLSELSKRMSECKLELHAEKTKIVYCNQGKQPKVYPNCQFDFLGFTFRTRKAKCKDGSYFATFTPAISKHSAKAVRQIMREWNLHRKLQYNIQEIARWINPSIRGWINYYGQYRRSELESLFQLLDSRLRKWAKWKYKKLRLSYEKAENWMGRIKKQNPRLFAHWSRDSI